MELGPAGRRDGRGIYEGEIGTDKATVVERRRRLRQPHGFPVEKEFKLGLDLERGLLLLGLASLVNRLADPASVLAVKGLLKRHVKRVGLSEGYRHGDPRDGLEGKPVTAGGDHQREHHQTFAQSRKHDQTMDRVGVKSIHLSHQISD